MKLSPLWVVLFLWATSGVAYAAKECKFYNGDTRQIMSPGTQPVITLLPPVSEATIIASSIMMELTPQMTTHCTAGDDGENVWQMTDNALLTGYTSDGKALFRTNIPGIEYAIAMYPTGQGVIGWFPTDAGAYYLTGNSHDNEDMLDEKKWHARMDIYQMPGFTKVPAGISFISSVGGPIGHVSVGRTIGTTEEDHPRPLITISDMLFNIPIVEPSCILTAPTTVDLGTWFRQDVENDKTTEVPFQITGSCVGTVKVSVVAKSANTTADKGLFTNAIQSNSSITAAKGVAVKISSPAYSQLYADGAPEAIATGVIAGAPVDTVNATYKAKLVRTGSEAVTSGVFGSTVTFQVTYE